MNGGQNQAGVSGLPGALRWHPRHVGSICGLVFANGIALGHTLPSTVGGLIAAFSLGVAFWLSRIPPMSP